MINAIAWSGDHPSIGSFGAQIEMHLHELDASHLLARNHPVDIVFQGDFKRGSLEAYHIAGHTPGFTVYIHNELLLICDYAFPRGPEIRLNPAKGDGTIREGGQGVLEITDIRGLKKVCSYNYITNFESWRKDFSRAVYTGS